MPTRVIYNSKRIIPAPLVGYERTFQTTSDGTILGHIYNFTVNGDLVVDMGSPTSSGTFWTSGGYPPDEVIADESHLGSILRKQDALRTLFATEGQSFEVQSADGSQPLRCNPRNIKINFPEGIWYFRSPYTISFECDVVYPEEESVFTDYISAFTETWQFETNEQAESVNQPYTYRCTHQLNVTGKRFYDDNGILVKPAWEQAREYARPRLGLDNNIFLSGVTGLPATYNGFNHIRSESVDEAAGSYGVSETWVLASGNAFEDFNISTNVSQDTGLTTVSIDGNIIGLDTKDTNMNITQSRWVSASGKFSTVEPLLFARAELYSAVTLNREPITKVIGKNPTAGTINYNFAYNTRPYRCFPDSKSESITVSDNLTTDLIAQIFVVGRQTPRKGPVLQDLQTGNVVDRTLNIELVMNNPYSSGCSTSDYMTRLLSNKPSVRADTSGILGIIKESVRPINDGASSEYIAEQSENWEATTGRYSYHIKWIYE